MGDQKKSPFETTNEVKWRSLGDYFEDDLRPIIKFPIYMKYTINEMINHYLAKIKKMFNDCRLEGYILLLFL